MPGDINQLPIGERVRHYRAMAKKAMRSADGAQNPLTKADLIQLAHDWHVLATQLESALGFTVDPDRAMERSSRIHFRNPQRPS